MHSPITLLNVEKGLEKKASFDRWLDQQQQPLTLILCKCFMLIKKKRAGLPDVNWIPSGHEKFHISSQRLERLGEHTNTRLNWAVGIGMIPPPRALCCCNTGEPIVF